MIRIIWVGGNLFIQNFIFVNHVENEKKIMFLYHTLVNSIYWLKLLSWGINIQSGSIGDRTHDLGAARAMLYCFSYSNA